MDKSRRIELLSTKPYYYKKHGILWMGFYGIYVDEMMIGAEPDKKEAKRIVDLLNGAFMMGVANVLVEI